VLFRSAQDHILNFSSSRMLAIVLSIAIVTLVTGFHVDSDPLWKGYYYRTWGGDIIPPAGANFGIAFSGWTNPAAALRDSLNVKDKLQGTKWISLGGGNANGRFSASSLDDINTAIDNGDFKDYSGIVFDVEEGDAGLAAKFESSFQKARTAGLIVLVTVSHSAPYGFSDGADLMRAFLSSSSIGFISPQLYTTGSETRNDYAISQGVQWSEYKSTQAVILPSIVTASLYNDAELEFANQGITTQGFIQWASG